MAKTTHNTDNAWFNKHSILSKYGKLEKLNALLVKEGGKGAQAVIDDSHMGCDYDQVEIAKCAKTKQQRAKTVDIVTIDKKSHLLMLECKFRADSGKSVKVNDVKEKFDDTQRDLQSDIDCGPICQDRVILYSAPTLKSKLKRLLANNPKYKVMTMEELVKILKDT